MRLEKINQRIGILGGGQLGKMLFIAGSPLGMDLHIMDKSRDYPAGLICHNYYEGDFTDYDDVLHFGKTMDILTIEIEKINVRALSKLEGMGKEVYPQAGVIEIIQDKGLQKDFFIQHQIPTAAYRKYNDLEGLTIDVQSKKIEYPFIQKIRKDGYDGRGVKTIRSAADLTVAFTHDFLVEEKVDIKKEIAVIVCRTADGLMAVYDPVEMVFDPDNHILLYQVGPAEIDPLVFQKAKALAARVADAFEITGLLAIEMFLTPGDELLVNEVAPRPHNSGHHSIEACACSQYENHLRAISGFPLGSTATLRSSLLMNLLGAPGYEGPVHYEGLEEVLQIDEVHVHLYGKTDTRPYRKMGHLTITGLDRQELIEKYNKVISIFNIIS